MAGHPTRDLTLAFAMNSFLPAATMSFSGSPNMNIIESSLLMKALSPAYELVELCIANNPAGFGIQDEILLPFFQTIFGFSFPC